MRSIISLAAVVGLLVTGWSAPTASADDSAQSEKILAQVAESLDEAGLSAEAKEAVLRDLKQSLANALGSDADEQPADDEQAEEQASDAQAKSKADAADSEETDGRRNRSQRPRAAQREQRRRASQDSAPQSDRFAIGVMLEKSEISDGKEQLVISGVLPGSPAAEAELQSGDVIRSLDGEALTDPNEVTRRIDQAGREDKPLALEIGRDDEVLTVEVKPAARPGNLAFEFSRPDWAFPAAPGMPGFGGWRFPAPTQAADRGQPRENVRRLEHLEQQVEQLRQAVEELQSQLAAEPETAEDEDSEKD